MVEARIRELLADFLTGTDEFVVDVKALPKARIQVFVDSDTALTIARCAKISRHLEQHLEEEGLVPERYNLEVSSPGVGQPLLLERQYNKNVGRKVEVKTNNGDTYKGLLQAVEENHIVLVIKTKDKETKKRIEQPVSVAFSDIQSTKVLVTF